MVPSTNRDPTDFITSADGPLLDERTAAVLDRLRNRPGPIPLSDLAADVADHESYARGRDDASAPTDVHRVRIRLHHVDLPALNEAGFLEYDESEQLVMPLERANRAPPSLDATFEVLAHRYRRAVLDCLDEQRPLDVPELAAEVARLAHGASIDEIPPTAVERIHDALHHVHLPKLRQAGAVRIDRGDGLVTMGENADWLLLVWRTVDTTREFGNPRSR